MNRRPTSVLSNNVSPYFTLFGKHPSYSSLMVFGCCCYPYLRSYNGIMFPARPLPCVFLGYRPNYMGYLCYHVPNQKSFALRHVILMNKSVLMSLILNQRTLVVIQLILNLVLMWTLFLSQLTSQKCLLLIMLYLQTSKVSTDSPMIDTTTTIVVVSSLIHVSMENSTFDTLLHTTNSNHSILTRSKLGVVKPNPKYALVNVVDTIMELPSVKVALKHLR